MLLKPQEQVKMQKANCKRQKYETVDNLRSVLRLCVLTFALCLLTCSLL